MNENENIIEEQVTEPEILTEKPEELSEKGDELTMLRAELVNAQLISELLLGGAAKEKLSEAVGFAEKFSEAGKTPAEAAAAVLTEYPHLKTVVRELPKMAVPSGGMTDGFAEIRRIFSGALR